MNTRKTWIFGMAALGLALAAPVHAAPDFIDGAFMVAKRERADEVRPDPRDARRDDRRANRRDAEREEPRGYGYGYERRQQQRFEDEDRPRGRR
ncbi:MAG: hypothetical protein A2X71_01125 [Thiobacillus sp. GWE1_62_9]|nr:MAG: hypothetical protein A2X71_01125 [Thiobacillus sp. GWE1_62_9]HBU30085.1 hypothetical protein [Thiobacillus sp.]